MSQFAHNQVVSSKLKFIHHHKGKKYILLTIFLPNITFKLSYGIQTKDGSGTRIYQGKQLYTREIQASSTGFERMTSAMQVHCRTLVLLLLFSFSVRNQILRFYDM